MKNKKNLGSYVLIRDEYGYGERIFEGTESECKDFCDKSGWEIDGKKLDMFTIWY